MECSGQAGVSMARLGPVHVNTDNSYEAVGTRFLTFPLRIP